MLVPPHPSSQEDPIHISCMAPRDFPGANFTLYQGEEVVQLLQAPADQLEVIFNLSGGSREVPGGPFCCQYGVLGEHRQPQLSNFSEPMHVSFPGKALPSFLTALGSIFSPRSLCRCCSLHLEVITGRATSSNLPDFLTFPCLVLTVTPCNGYSHSPHFPDKETEAQAMKRLAQVTQPAGGRALNLACVHPP